MEGSKEVELPVGIVHIAVKNINLLISVFVLAAFRSQIISPVLSAGYTHNRLHRVAVLITADSHVNGQDQINSHRSGIGDPCRCVRRNRCRHYHVLIIPVLNLIVIPQMDHKRERSFKRRVKGKGCTSFLLFIIFLYCLIIGFLCLVRFLLGGINLLLLFCQVFSCGVFFLFQIFQLFLLVCKRLLRLAHLLCSCGHSGQFLSDVVVQHSVFRQVKSESDRLNCLCLLHRLALGIRIFFQDFFPGQDVVSAVKVSGPSEVKERVQRSKDSCRSRRE